MNNVLFPFWLWLLIVLIIILIVLWFLFRPESEERNDSSDGSGPSAGVSEASVVSAPPADEVPDEPAEAPEPEPEPSRAGIVHIVDSDDEDEPAEEVSEPLEESGGEAADEDFEDTVVSEERADIGSDRPAAEDNLRIIEGIGPKIESVLKAAGIKTLRQLSELSAEAIQTILTDNNLRLANPESWPEQARLAANGDTEALAALQDKLKGGRIV